MFEKLTQKFLAAHGIARTDAPKLYAESFPYLDLPSLNFQEATTHILHHLLGPQVEWKLVPRGILTGNADDTTVVRAVVDHKVYYLKFTKLLRVQLGMLFAHSFFIDQPHPFCSTATIVSHGLTTIKNKTDYYFMLLEEAQGEDLIKAFKEKNDDIIIPYVETLAKTLAHNHSIDVSKAPATSKLFYATERTNFHIQRILRLSNESTDDPSLNFAIQSLLPFLFDQQNQYMKATQSQCFSICALKNSNLAFSKQQNKLLMFDTTVFFNSCSPSRSPRWAPESNFATSFHHLEFLEHYLDLDPSKMEGYRDHFLRTYYQNIQHPIMTAQGLNLFTAQAYLESVKNFLAFRNKTNQFQEKALKMISQFGEMSKRGNPKIGKLLGY